MFRVYDLKGSVRFWVMASGLGFRASFLREAIGRCGLRGNVHSALLSLSCLVSSHGLFFA